MAPTSVSRARVFRNPKTKRKVKKDSPTYKKLIEEGVVLCPIKHAAHPKTKRCVKESNPDIKALGKCEPGRVRKPSGKCGKPEGGESKAKLNMVPVKSRKPGRPSKKSPASPKRSGSKKSVRKASPKSSVSKKSVRKSPASPKRRASKSSVRK